MNLVVGLTFKIFIIMAIGFGAKKFGIIDEQCKDKMSSLLVNLLLPVSMLASSQQAFNMENLKGVVLIAVITVLYYVVTIVAGGFVGKIFGMDDAKSAMFTLLVAFANTGFVGLPILGTVAGKTGTLYGAVYNSVFDVLYFTYGIYLLSGEKKDGINLKKILLNPMIMVAVITIILYVVPFRMPMVVTDSLGLIGDCMMPVSMFLIGAEIASMNVKEILCDRDSYIVSLFRMLIIPFVMYILMVSLKTEHTLDNEKKKTDELSKIRSELSSKSGVAQGKAETSHSTLLLEWNSISGETVPGTMVEQTRAISDGLIKYENENNNKIKESEYKIADIKRQVLLKQEYEQTITECKDNIEKKKQFISSLEKSLEVKKETLRQQTGQYAEIVKMLKYEDIEKAKKKLEEEIAAKKSFDEELNKIKSDYDNAKFNFITCRQRADDLKKQIESFDNIENIEQKVSDCNIKRKENADLSSKLGEQINTIKLRISNNTKILSEIEKINKDIENTSKKWQIVNSLSSTANGTISGKEKILLETYVQMSYFDRIIKKANIRFMMMTSGRYELVRSVNPENLRSQSGLELDVYDHYNAVVRSVKTLSGGESFMASLSLALGLSDEVQSSSGGIQVDTMFVDEGFGSLDEESLNQALNALWQLADSNRLIGIISHVGELKNRIENQIIVKKKRTGGSEAVIITA